MKVKHAGALAQQRLRPAQGAKPPSARERGWGPAGFKP
jgi:hypothetical protein